MNNESGLKPLGRAVLVKPYEIKKESVIVIPDTAKERSMMMEQRVIVVEVGPACWPNEPARAKPGDKVLVAKLTGWMTNQTLDGEMYRLVNDNDIFCKIEEES